MILAFLLFLAQANLTITADSAATLTLDGKDAGALQPGVALQLTAEPGEHQLLVTPTGGGSPLRKLVYVASGSATAVTLPLRAHLLRGEIQQKGVWKDDRTVLTWAAADSGAGVTVSQAKAYCAQLVAGGFRDWRLPEITEVATLFGGPQDERGFRVIVPLKLSGWAWSATQGNERAENWAFDFADGARASVAAGDAGLNRALCVRQ